MEISPALIERFLKKECSAEEAARVARYLHEHPEALDHFYNMQEFDATPDATLDDIQMLQSWENLQRHINRGRVITLWKKVAVAAAIISVLWFSYVEYQQKPSQELAISDSPIDRRTMLTNLTDSAAEHLLMDGSTVKLAAHSTIWFDSAVWKTERKIELEGDGTFYVSKDKTKPFTVYSRDISVTALGTIFSVENSSGNDIAKVKLFEGKVLVKNRQVAGGSNSHYRVDSVTLTAGEEVIIGNDHSLAVTRFLQPETIAPKAPRNIKRPNTSPLTRNNQGWVEFDNQPLHELFTSLEVIYNVDIVYSKHEVENIFFMGRFETYDTIESILEIIGKLNNLAIEKTASGKYSVRKN